ncbi:hypothetical protein F5X99DRAFT_401121 [Biscogniauxia marginata]|nr:hypothetical protein F5X99DRAFT_401121 [Biscogniauxia marginata]
MASTTDDITGEALLYFAYGSNLSTTQMRERCPASTPIGLAHLAEWTWIINERGYANIVQNSNNHGTQDPQDAPAAPPKDSHPGVYGLLYRLDPSDEPSLDACEGVPWAYERRMVDATVIKGDGKRHLRDGAAVRVLAYVDEQRVLQALPKPEYVGRMNRGIDEAAAAWAFPRAYVDEVMRPFIPAP